MDHTKIIQVAIIDDHTLFREGLANLLGEFDDIRIMFSARNGQEMIDKTKTYIPDIVLMDINMPVMNGYESTKWLKQNLPDVRVLALSMYEDENSIIKMIRAGAGGYILKECSRLELINGVRHIYTTGYFMNDIVSGKLINSIRGEKQTDTSVINEKEKFFLQLCCSELTYKEIAEKMNVSPRTIDTYRDNLFEKLQLKSRTGLVVYSIKNGIIEI